MSSWWTSQNVEWYRPASVAPPAKPSARRGTWNLQLSWKLVGQGPFAVRPPSGGSLTGPSGNLSNFAWGIGSTSTAMSSSSTSHCVVAWLSWNTLLTRRRTERAARGRANFTNITLAMLSTQGPFEWTSGGSAPLLWSRRWFEQWAPRRRSTRCIVITLVGSRNPRRSCRASMTRDSFVQRRQKSIPQPWAKGSLFQWLRHWRAGSSKDSGLYSIPRLDRCLLGSKPCAWWARISARMPWWCQTTNVSWHPHCTDPVFTHRWFRIQVLWNEV